VEAQLGRFYFHVHKGKKLIPDEEGRDLPDVHAAVHEAQLAARELLAEAVHAGKGQVPDASSSPMRRGDPFAPFLLSPFCRSGLGCKLLPAGILKAGRRAHATTCRIP
jgi:hypothetical protein